MFDPNIREFVLRIMRLRVLILCLTLLVMAMIVPDAYAQTTAPVVTLGTIWDTWLPLVLVVCSAIVTVFVGWIAMYASQHFGVQISANMRDTLQSAINTGLHMGLTAFGNLLDQKPIEAKNGIIQMAIQWVAGPGAKDALKHFGIDPTDPKFQTMIEGKLEQILGLPSVPTVATPVASVPVGTTVPAADTTVKTAAAPVA